jgi:hypothetical protein
LQKYVEYVYLLVFVVKLNEQSGGVSDDDDDDNDDDENNVDVGKRLDIKLKERRGRGLQSSISTAHVISFP